MQYLAQHIPIATTCRKKFAKLTSKVLINSQVLCRRKRFGNHWSGGSVAPFFNGYGMRGHNETVLLKLSRFWLWSMSGWEISWEPHVCYCKFCNGRKVWCRCSESGTANPGHMGAIVPVKAFTGAYGHQFGSPGVLVLKFVFKWQGLSSPHRPTVLWVSWEEGSIVTWYITLEIVDLWGEQESPNNYQHPYKLLLPRFFEGNYDCWSGLNVRCGSGPGLRQLFINKII